jgi:uncharacterized protein (DUF885 family)
MKLNLPAIKTLIQSGDLENAAQQLLTFAQTHSSRFTNEALGHLARLKQIVSDERKGVVSAETTRMSKNQLTFALLDLIDEMEEEARGKAGASSAVGRGKKKDIVFEGAVGQVIIQQSHKGDNIVEKKEKVIEIGANAHISAPVVIADRIENSFNALAESKVDQDVKALLEQLLKAVNEVNKSAAAGQAQMAQEMARDAETLVKEAASSSPRRKWYEVSIEGLKQAAINIGEVAAPVVGILAKLAPLLLH